VENESLWGGGGSTTSQSLLQFPFGEQEAPLEQRAYSVIHAG